MLLTNMADFIPPIAVTLLQVLKLTKPDRGFALMDRIFQSLEVIGRITDLNQTDELSLSISIEDESIKDLDQPLIIMQDCARSINDISNKLMSTRITTKQATTPAMQDSMKDTFSTLRDENSLKGANQLKTLEHEAEVVVSGHSVTYKTTKRGWNFATIGANFQQEAANCCSSNNENKFTESNEQPESSSIECALSDSIILERSPAHLSNIKHLFHSSQLEFSIGNWIKCIGVPKFCPDGRIRFFATSIIKVNGVEDIERHQKKIFSDYKMIVSNTRDSNSCTRPPKHDDMSLIQVERPNLLPLFELQQTFRQQIPIEGVPTIEYKKRSCITDDKDQTMGASLKKRKLDETKSKLESTRECGASGNLGSLNTNQRLVLEILRTRQRGFTAEELNFELEDKISLNDVRATLSSLAENGLCWSDSPIEGNEDLEVWWLVD